MACKEEKREPRCPGCKEVLSNHDWGIASKYCEGETISSPRKQVTSQDRETPKEKATEELEELAEELERFITAGNIVRLHVQKDDNISTIDVLLALKHHEHKIIGAEGSYRGSAIDIVCEDENTATEIATHGFDHGDRHYNLRVAAKPRTHVSVFVPIAMPDNELTTLLARYGKIACLRRLHYKEQDLQQYENGVCVVEFESLDTVIPSRIHYAGINISFVYTGQPKTCVRCGAMDHLVKECPITKRPRNKLDNTDQQDRPQQRFNTSSPAAQQQPSTPTSDMDDTDDVSEIADEPPLDPSTITTALPTKRNLTNELQATAGSKRNLVTKSPTKTTKKTKSTDEPTFEDFNAFYNQLGLTDKTLKFLKLSVEDEKIFKFEIATPSIREGAVVAANNEETSKYMIATPSIREGAVPAANNEETSKYMVATPSIREGAVPAANNEETSKYMVATPSIREGAVPAANNEETSKYMVATPSIREGAVLAANNEETTSTVELQSPRKAKGSCRGCGIPKSKHSFGAPHKNCEGPEKKSDVEGLRSEVDEMKTSLKAIATAVERLVSPTTSATQQTVKAESSQVVNLDELRKFKCLEDDVDQHIAKLGLNDSSSDSEDSDAPEEPHSTPRSRGQLSAAPSSVELSYLDMNYEQFIAGELEIINAGPINKHEREQQLRHLTDIAKDATVYPWPTNPLDLPLATSPLSAVPKRDSTDKRIVMDLSFPTALSVNDGIPNDNFLGDSYTLTYRTIHSLLDLVRQHGNGCLLYKLDLRRAYRQFPVDPRDYHLLGLWWKDMYFIDMRLPFGLRSAPQACQRITDAVRYMHLRDGYHLVNYLDDFCGVSSPERASAGFSALRSLLQELGLDEAYEKAVSPTTRLTFIGLEVDTIAMTVSVPEDKL
ncbi:hypothetical protein QZH41_001989 [Actinostola sp. cb2023]|nr:hypothetical protein QZH41_001989 [Actinostola sp. cb2023]